MCQSFYFSGITGGSEFLIAQAFAYLSDVTSNENRLFRIAVLLTSKIIAMGGINLALGYLIRDYGFGPCLWLIAIAYFTAFLYIAIPCFLIETGDRKGELMKSRNADSGKIISAGVKDDLLSLFKINMNMRRLRMRLLLVIDFMRELLESSLPLVITYGLGPPFCWSSVQVTGYSMSVLFGCILGKLRRFLMINNIVIIQLESLSIFK